MRTNVLLFVFIISGLIAACQNATKLSNESYKSAIKGKWEVEKIETIGGYNDLLELEEDSSFYTFFSSNDWENAKGEFFYFDKENAFSTSLLPQEAKKFIGLRYFMDNNQLKIECVQLQRNNSKVQLYLNIDSLTKSKMIWMFGSYMKITLKKVIRP